MAATVAVLGAGGTMGMAMARNVMAAGMTVRAWNRTRERAEPLAAEGAHLAATPAEAADGADVVLTMLADGDAVTGAMDGPDGALAAAAEGAVWLQTSTIGEAATARCAALAAAAGVPFVDAPVLGTKGPAEEGALIVLASGPEDARERVRPVLDAVGRRTMWVGDAGAGTRLKLVTNAWILAVVEGAAEAVALAEGLGLDPGLLLEAVEGGPLDLPYLRMKAAAMRARDFTPAFRLSLAAKDAALVEQSAAGRGMDLPLVAAVARRLAQGVAAHGDEDVAATYLMSWPDASAAS
jgi:3-hydroxyisobutyrate dehydrogenase